MNIISKTIRSTQFLAVVTLMLLSLIPAFFIHIKDVRVAINDKKIYAKSSFFSVNDIDYRWQKALLYWARFDNPMIFTDEGKGMSFIPMIQRTNFAHNPLPLAQIDPEQFSLGSDGILPITFLPTPSYAWLLQQTFGQFSTLPIAIEEMKITTPQKVIFSDSFGQIITLISDFDESQLKGLKIPAETTKLELSGFESTFPRILVKSSCGDPLIDQLAVKKLSTFLLSSDSREKWLKQFNNAPKMSIEVEWRLRGTK